MKNKVMLSVIVPVYNVAPYLRDCLDSLLAQGFSEGEYEVIVVDDGSTDSSLEIIQKYARENSCIHCIHQSNAGVSAARNTGLDKATGEYVAFIDGDDFLAAGVLKLFCDEAKKRTADMLVYGFAKVHEDAHFCDKKHVVDLTYTNNVSGVAVSTATACRSLYKRDFIEKII